MAILIDSVDDLQAYLVAVRERATHHAPNVDEVLLALAGAVVLFKDPGTALQVRSHRGTMANVLWATIGGTRYTFTYNHTHQAVEVRERTLRGQPVAQFNDSTTADRTLATFSRLSNRQ